MKYPVYQCPHCKKKVEIELTDQGELRLNGYPSPKSLPSTQSQLSENLGDSQSDSAPRSKEERR